MTARRSPDAPAAVPPAATDQADAVRRLFESAAAATADERRRLLAAARATDPLAADEVESLLQHHDRTDVFIDRSPVLTPAPPAPSTIAPGGGHADDAPELPAPFGSYTLLNVLGSGGMGVVYEAEQASPRRRVAVKLIRPELVSSSMLRRFEHEAEALGMLAHPGIAQVYEAGRAPLAGSSRAFIAMELVSGPPISEFARKKNLGREQKLALLAEVCDAIDSAHRRGIIHRDLKPGNILVTPEGRPKVLDFGVARLVGHDQPAAANATTAGQIVGTLAYMSPEQASGGAGDLRNIDSRSDVYALGAVLFELLCGRPPIDVSKLSLHSALATIQTSEPRIPQELRAALGADARAILLKALEKDPARRYQHASDLAADIRRSLRREPVIAREPSALYQASRFCARNKELVAAAVLVLASLLAAVAGISAALVRAERAREDAVLSASEAGRARDDALASAERATQNLSRYKAMSGFLHGLLRSAGPGIARGGDTSILRAMLELSESELSVLENEPEAMADASGLLGTVFRELGDFQRAERHSKRSFELYKQTLGETHPDTLIAMHNLGALYRGSLRRYADAEPLLRRALELFTATYGADGLETRSARNSLALLYMDQERYSDALPILADMLASGERLGGPDHAATLRTANNHAGVLDALGRHAEAEAEARRVYDARCRILGADHPDAVTSLMFLATTLRNQDRAAEALPLNQQALEQRRAILGESHQGTIAARAHLAQTLRELDRLDQALEVASAAFAGAEASLGPDHLDTILNRLAVLEIQITLGRCDGAQEECRAIRAALEPRLAPGSSWFTRLELVRALALACAGDHTAGETAMLAVYAGLESSAGPADRAARRAAKLIAGYYASRAREADAAAWLQRAAYRPG